VSAVSTRRASRNATLSLVVAAALWGGMYVVSAGTFDRVPPVTLCVLRLVVGLGVLLVAFRGRIGWGQAPRRRVVAAGAVVALTMVLQFQGTSLTGAAEGAILTTTTPAFVLLFGGLLEGERIRRVAWIGVLVALAGVVVLALGSVGAGVGAEAALTTGGADDPLVATASRLAGDLMLVGAAATWALFSSIGRPLVAAVGAFRAIMQATAVALLLLLPIVPLELAGQTLPPLEPATIGAVLYLGIGSTAIGWSLWYRGYAAAPPAVSAAAFFAQPVVGATLGVLVLGELLGPAFLVGSALIAAGVVGIGLAAGADHRHDDASSLVEEPVP
jgi:drug/metabolite transporter (DMT)-like permease